MNERIIEFENLNWETPSNGVKQKIFTKGNQKIRLVHFNDDFREIDWCSKGHVGYVIKGEMSIDFNGVLVNFKKGNGLWIEGGEKSKHKVIIAEEKFAELLLFETI